MENINKMQIVPDEVYEIGADKAPVIPEWSVKDDTTLWQKVNKLAHSTFDLSKFTAQGVATITNSGVATFSTSNTANIQLPYLLKPENKTWEIYIHFKTGSSWNTDDGLFVSQAGSPQATTPIALRGKDKFELRGALSDGTYGTRLVGYTLALNTEYWCKASYDGSAYRLYHSNDNGKTYIEDNHLDSATPFENSDSSTTYPYSYLGTGRALSNAQQFNGEIYLPDFKIIVNGVPVFSGNKTGVDTIKPDDYTPEGSIASTITADGIASGFSESNYLTLPYQYSDNVINYVEKITFTTASDVTTRQPIRGINENANKGIGITINSGKMNYRIGTGTSWQQSDSTVSVSTNTTYTVEFTQTSTTTTFKLYSENGALLDTTSVNHVNLLYAEIVLGINKIWSNEYFRGSIDLKEYKIYLDGDLVYQPCLMIPYTEGQNYVKVVDKLYRDRVKYLFEQKGYNGYYTIGEDDFTLPSNKWSDVIEHKENGLTVAEQRVDQTLIIRGACEQGVDVNLPMEFFSADSYAVFGVGTTGTNTASKFTPAADGNYIAIGKGKV